MSKQEESRFNPFAARSNKSTVIKHIIAIASGKGGVGKSMVTGLLASSLNQLGFSVGILDGDVTGPSIGKMFNITSKASGQNDLMNPAISKQGIKIISANMLLEDESVPIVWRGPMIANAVKEFYIKVQWGDLDVLLIDMPPGTGDVPMTVYQAIPIDGIVMVTTPQDLVSMVVSKAISMARQMNVNILGVIENMSYVTCPGCNEVIYPFGKSRTQKLVENNQLVLLAQLPILPALTTASDEGTIDLVENKQMIEVAKSLLFKLEK